MQVVYLGDGAEEAEKANPRGWYDRAGYHCGQLKLSPAPVKHKAEVFLLSSLRVNCPELPS